MVGSGGSRVVGESKNVACGRGQLLNGLPVMVELHVSQALLGPT
jgi:hypothetical protein